jgi:uncharacterized protein YbaR (Trm112 family)
MLKCPECEKELYWLTDQDDEGHITSEYHCEQCKIDVIKHRN